MTHCKLQGLSEHVASPILPVQRVMMNGCLSISASTSRCGRERPGSTPGGSIIFFAMIIESNNVLMAVPQEPHVPRRLWAVVI